MVPPVLFSNKDNCCACGACLNICPQNAIEMIEDDCGFIYPKINKDECVNCGACTRVCAFQNGDVTNSPIDCFAAVSKNKEQALKSASAGIFSAIATKVLSEGGVVFGAAFDSEWNVSHIKVESLQELSLLQGSKYVHSNTKYTFKEAKKCLDEGKNVVYSGTPCQIDGFKKYLGREYEKLLTIDIVCHGVPSNRMFKDYIRLLETKHGGEITSFTFRDKSLGWGINGSVIIDDKKIKLWQSASSYLFYFSKASIYRDNCYKCKYAGCHRPADLTIGDFWGIEKEHPEYIGRNKWDESKGISLIVVNTDRGQREMVSVLNYIDVKKSDYLKISKWNAQLQMPSTASRIEVLNVKNTYANGGWKAVDEMFYRNISIKRYGSQIKAFFPKGLKRLLKRFK